VTDIHEVNDNSCIATRSLTVETNDVDFAIDHVHLLSKASSYVDTDIRSRRYSSMICLSYHNWIQISSRMDDIARTASYVDRIVCKHVESFE
jgi:hypothetical protein